MEGLETLIVFTVLNDLGKVESVVEYVRSKTGVDEVDHDKILMMGKTILLLLSFVIIIWR